MVTIPVSCQALDSAAYSKLRPLLATLANITETQRYIRIDHILTRTFDHGGLGKESH